MFCRWLCIIPQFTCLLYCEKNVFFPGDRECLHPYKELNHNISVLPFTPSPSTTASTQTNALKRTFNKIYHFPQVFTFTAMSSALSTLTSFCFSHVVLLGQPDLIKHSETVYMHQITLHALCREASGVVLKSPSFPLFALHLSSLYFLEHRVFPAYMIFCQINRRLMIKLYLTI